MTADLRFGMAGRIRYMALAGALLWGGSAAWAHLPGGSDAHGGWWSRWNFDPLITINLLLLGGVYGFGLWRLWSQAGVGRSVSRGQAWAFAAGMVALVAALLSPIDTLAGELSWVHMVQHMLLMKVAAPLVVLGAPLQTALWTLPVQGRRRAGRWKQYLDTARLPRYFLWQPLTIWLLFAFTLWVWHLPAFYGAALRSGVVHDFQHLTFFAGAVLFWRILLDPVSRWRLSRGAAVLYLFATSLHAMVLGVFMTFSPVVWYGGYEGLTEAWGMTALEDQQMAGIIMWMPACMVFAVVAALLLAHMLQQTDAIESSRSPR
jgi:putative membrane protein